MNAYSTIGESSESRRAERKRVRIAAGFRRQGSHRAKAEIVDLSTSGFRIEILNSLPIGNYVWLTLPGLGSTCARVAWCKGNYAGCEFLEPLHPAVLDRLAAEARAEG
ncbi:MAG: PilZ domain-containing protein [Sphingomonadaceae bacterium]